MNKDRHPTSTTLGTSSWAEAARIGLTIVDDRGSRQAAIAAYGAWLDTVDLLIGPYASGLVRAIVPLVRESGRILWNHGGSADDLTQPPIASLPPPHRRISTASSMKSDKVVERGTLSGVVSSAALGP